MPTLRLIVDVVSLIALVTALGAPAPRPAAAQSGIIYVRAGAVAPGDGTSWATAYPSLQSALLAAASGAELWVAAGRYMPAPANGSRTATFQLKNGVAVYGGFAGTETQRDQRNWAANVVTLSGDLNGNDGANFANNGENSYSVVTGATGATLDGVTISGGNSNKGLGGSNGGGIFNQGSNPVLSNVTISGNSALSSGGGMYNNNSSPTLTNVTISGNSAGSGGGGMFNNFSSPTLTNVTFSGNTAGSGGGIYNLVSNPTLTNVTISGNSAGNGGGGGMSNQDNSNPTLTNVTVSGNFATANGSAGGGIRNYNSSPTLTNVTISGNAVTVGPGGGMSNANNSNPQIRNSIVWGNTAPNGSAIFSDASTPTISNSLIEGGVPISATNGGGNLSSDPLFVTPINPANAPTTAGDLRLRDGSPAVDAGNDSFVASATDLDGNPRRLDGNLDGTVRVDMGAYEHERQGSTQSGIIYVRAGATAPGDGTSWATAYPSLQSALLAAASGAEVWVAAGRYTPTSASGDRAATFQLKDGVAIYGGFAGTETLRNQRNWAANVVTLSGDLNGDDVASFANNGENSIHVVTGANGAILDGVTISAGNANVNAPGMNAGGGMANFSSSPLLANVIISANAAVAGGGMYNEDSSPTLSNVTFTGNLATEDSGGGIYNLSSSPTLTNVTISGNTANDGGGMINLSSNPTLTSVTISGNSAGSGSGGGMANFSSSPLLASVIISANAAVAGGGMYNEDSSPTLTNVTFTGNLATEDSGGGIYNLSSSPTLTNVTISGNSAATGGGGGIYNLVSGPTMTNVTISGNSAEAGGGMFNQGSNPTLTNVAVSGNSATDSGGGMFNTSSSPILTNVTINGNSADNSGGGMFNEVNSNPQIRNSIVWGNGSTAIVNNASAPAFSYSLIEGGVPISATDGGSNLNADPLFVTPINPANAPTTAGDLRLRAGSPAIDAGNDDVTNPVLPTTDRDGNPRRLDGNLDGIVRVDMGAYERGIYYRVLIPLINR